MGFIDKTTYTLTCPKCGANESKSVLEKGSSWGSSWQSRLKLNGPAEVTRSLD